MKKYISSEIKKAKAGGPPAAEHLYTHVYEGEAPPFIRGVEYDSSVITKGSEKK